MFVFKNNKKLGSGVISLREIKNWIKSFVFNAFALYFIVLSCACNAASKSILNNDASKEVVSYEQMMKAYWALDANILYRVASQDTSFLTDQQIELIFCIYKRDLSCFDILAQDMTLNDFVNPAGSEISPFEIAIREFSPEFVERFLELGVSPDAISIAPSKGGSNRLFLSSYLYLLIVKYHKYKYGARETSNFGTKYRPVDYSKNAYKLLRQRELNPVKVFYSKRSGKEFTLGDIKQVFDLLLSYGVNVNLVDFSYGSKKPKDEKGILSCGSSIQMVAYKSGISEMADALLEEGADVGYSNCPVESFRQSAAFWANYHNDADTFNSLLPYLSQDQIKSISRVLKPGVARSLFEADYDPNEYGLLFSAIRYNDVWLFDQLLNDPSIKLWNVSNDLDTRNTKSSALYSAVYRGDIYMVKKLVEKGARACDYKVSAAGKVSGSALDLAVKKQQSDRDTFDSIVETLRQAPLGDACKIK